MLRRKIERTFRRWLEEPYKDCLLVKGVRQCGKTFSIERFMEDNFENHVTLNFLQHPEHKKIFESSSYVDDIMDGIEAAFPGFRAVPGKTAMLLDEIQECSEARTAIKTFVLDGRYRILASGKIPEVDLVEVRSRPVGYERPIAMRPLDFEEFLWAMGVEDGLISSIRGRIRSKERMDQSVVDRMEDLFRTFMCVGGMPEAVEKYTETRNLDDVREVQGKILQGYRNDICRRLDPEC